MSRISKYPEFTEIMFYMDFIYEDIMVLLEKKIILPTDTIYNTCDRTPF